MPRAAERGCGVELVALALAVGLACFGWGGLAGSEQGYDPGEGHPGGLRVVTWNVGGSAGGGHRLSSAAFDAVAETLRRLDPELVFLQELTDSAQLEGLAGALGESARSILSAGGGRRVGALAQRGMLVPLRLAEEPPGALMAVLYQPLEGPSVHAVALHAHPFSAAARNAEIGAAADLLAEPSWGARLLCGDLNLDLDRGARQDLFSDDEHLDVETYNYVAARLLDAGLGGGSTAEPDRRLDYVFIDPEVLEVVGAGPWRGRRVGDMDHHPLVVDLAFVR